MIGLPDNFTVEVNFVGPESESLILDDSERGLLDAGKLGGGLEWVDVTDCIRSGSINRGVSRFDGIYGRAEAGTAELVLDNLDARFDPTNLSGPYVLAGASQIKPMRAFRIRAGGFDLFRGFADSWDLSYPLNGNDAVCTLRGTDGTKVLANFDGPEQGSQGAGEDTGARIERVLDNAGWPEADRDIDQGVTDVQATTLAQPAWTEILLTADTEIGEVYFDGAGKLVFRNRHALITEERSATSQATFADRSFALGHPIFEEAFDYSDGSLSSVSGGVWDDPIRSTGSSMNVTSGQVGGLNLGNYTADDTYGEGDYGVEIGVSGTWALYVCARPDSESGIDGYTILNLGGVLLQLYRFDNTVGTLLGQVSVSTSPGDVYGIRREGASLIVYEVSGGTTTELMSATDATYSSGRIMIETFDGTAKLASLFHREIGLPFTDLDLAYDDERIANLIRITRVGGVEQVAEDADSQETYLVRSFERSDLIHQTDVESGDYANYVLSILKDGELRIDSITIDPRRDPTRLYPHVLARELGDRISVKWTPPGRPDDPIERECFIRGIRHSFDAQGSWITTWALQDASRLSFFVLDHPILGRLDESRLTF